MCKACSNKNPLDVSIKIKQFFIESPPACAGTIGFELAKQMVALAKKKFPELNEEHSHIKSCLRVWNDRWGSPLSINELEYLEKTKPLEPEKKLSSKKKNELLESQQPKLEFE